MVARRFLIGSFFVQSFLQFSLCLQIELLVLTLWLAFSLPCSVVAVSVARRHSDALATWGMEAICVA